jgi:probable phosphoglycerate mutase
MSTQLPQIFLMRHGETLWSLSGQHSGHADVAITENGKLEAKQLAKQVEHILFQHILVSPLRRAKQTCLAAGMWEDARMEPDLKEWDNGEFEGQTRLEIERSHPGWNLFRDGCSGGESPPEISARADLLKSKLEKLQGNIALFTHGHFGRVLGARWIGLSVEFAERLLLDTASLSILGYQHNNATKPVISLWNSRSGERPPPS